ncbi:DUF2079 domain-containing protein [Catenulispora sp. NF23]|uniref:DUF2079 domain-containing protein n=1 Tax=Catenulispora pinistramenti TaxID=2705254 RepID=A0ABS5KUR7_9ACTN|nr:DUF2079 domain-containing protein [Catenulispora pinistramenti]MBS2534177.1 DUF2079 domain-containing protein [Catenulispora pinistramenti]MBS2549785.1 DUF2079 domain-containing protein [Catenulispora pinistramenti]
MPRVSAEVEGDGPPVIIARFAPWLIAAGAFVLYALIAILRYERRESMSWDLGIFTEAVRDYAHFQAPMVAIRGERMDLLGDHWHPILMLLGPFFRVFPTPVTLLVAQSLLLALAAVPLTRTAIDFLGRYQGYAIGTAYGLSWGVVQAANFDFHEVAFAVPAIAFSLCAYIRRDYRRTILWALPLLFVKEDLALLVPIIIAIVLVRARFSGRIVTQGAVLVSGVALGVLTTSLLVKVVIPHFNPNGVYEYWNEGGCLNPQLHTGLGKLVTCVPRQFMNGIGVKERTVLMTLLPVAFVALRSPLVLLAVPALVARFVNVMPSYWGTDFHYSVVPMVVVFAAAIHGLILIKESRERAAEAAADDLKAAGDDDGRPQTWLRTIGDAQLRHGAVVMLGIAVALTQSFPLNDLWQHETWFPSARAKAIKRAEALVPSGVTVETTVAMLPALAARTDALWIGNSNIVVPPDYEAFDIDRSGWAGEPSALDFVLARHPGYDYQQVFADPADNVYVFKRTD